MKKFLVTALIVILISLFMLEISLRLLKIVPTRVVNESIYPGILGDYKPSQRLWSDYCIPHYIKINSFGLRGAEITLRKPPGVYRILFLGDSYAFGSRVNNEETFPQQLEGLFRAAGSSGLKIEVINAAHDAYSTREEYEYLFERGIKLSPDLVILAWFPNDIAELARGGSWRDLLKEHYKFEPFKSYVRQLALFNALRIHISHYFIIHKIGSYVSMEEVDVFDSKDTELERELWDKCYGYILKTKQFCDNNRVKFLLAALPDYKQFGRDNGFGLQDKLAEFCRSNNLDFLDLSLTFKSFAAAGNIGELYLFPKDCHFSARGNRVVAEGLFDYLRARQESFGLSAKDGSEEG